jgi:hypothetical protein
VSWSKGKQNIRAGWPTIVTVGIVVFAFMAPSLAIKATGTTRFAVAMGYSRIIGYAIGAIFDLAKDVLLVAILVLCKQRELIISIILSLAWLGLVTYSPLATLAGPRQEEKEGCYSID